MPSSCGQPMILSVITMDLAPAADEREHFFCYTGIITDIGPFGEPAPKICGLGMLRRNNTDRELGCRPIVRPVESDGSYRVAAKSSLSSLAQPLACTLNHLFVATRRQLLGDFGRSGADFLPVQNGPETVGLVGAGGVSAVGLRLGGIVTFCRSLSRLAAVQGSSLIVSLPRFVRRVE